MDDIQRFQRKLLQIKQQLLSLEGPKYCPQEPFGTQKLFLELECLEALFGGGVGGGKSSALLMAALQYVHIPGYAALILRRSYSDLALPGAIMSRSQEWLLGTDAHWSGLDKRWTFPSGATLSFGYLSGPHDKYRYMGSELHFIGYDEVTQFEESQYTYLISRLRKPNEFPVPLRMRAATNPGGIGHSWCHRRFIVEGPKEGRVFVPSLLGDNPHLDQVEYRKALESLDSITRRQLLDGEWVEDNSGLVYKFNKDINSIESLPPGNWSYILGMDFGLVDHTAFTVIGWRQYDKTLYICESFGDAGIIPAEAGRIAQELEKKYKFSRIVGDTGGLGKAFSEEMRRRYHIPVEAADKQNKLGYISLLNGMLEQGLLKIYAPLCESLLKEMRELPWHPSHRMEHPGFANHATDSALYATRAAYAYLEPDEPEALPIIGSPAYYEHKSAEMERLAVQNWERKQREGEW